MAQTNMSTPNGDLPPLSLPPGVEESYVDCTSSCGLTFHLLTTGTPGNPLILFCHGYPELAFSWRKVMSAMASSGYYCVAMDQRGYGRTTGWDTRDYDSLDLGQWTLTNLVRDLVCLVYKLGYMHVHSIIGHDFGGLSSATAALMRPDIFQSTVQMSHPHKAPPTPPHGNSPSGPQKDIQADLAALNPPRKHYKWYNSTPDAASDWANPNQGLSAYLRGYFHLKSGNWAPNAHTHPLKAWSAEQLAELPEYYVMPLDETFPQCVERNMQGEDASATESWLPEEDLAVYVQEWSRTGFQGALNWYRAQTGSTPQGRADMLLFAGRRVEVPCIFISGSRDWGNFQQPGAMESYAVGGSTAVQAGCSRGVRMIEGAGHWVQQEKGEEVVKELLQFLGGLNGGSGARAQL